MYLQYTRPTSAVKPKRWPEYVKKRIGTADKSYVELTALNERRLGKSTAIILRWLLIDQSNGRPHNSLAYLAERSGVSHATCKRALAKLRKLSVVEATTRQVGPTKRRMEITAVRGFARYAGGTYKHFLPADSVAKLELIVPRGRPAAKLENMTQGGVQLPRNAHHESTSYAHEVGKYDPIDTSNISKNTCTAIKKIPHTSRRGVGGAAKAAALPGQGFNQAVRQCRYCQREISPVNHGRPRQHCSQACRRHAQNALRWAVRREMEFPGRKLRTAFELGLGEAMPSLRADGGEHYWAWHSERTPITAPVFPHGSHYGAVAKTAAKHLGGDKWLYLTMLQEGDVTERELMRACRQTNE